MEINDTASSRESMITFNDDEVLIVKTALKTKLFKADESKEVRTAKFQTMLAGLSEKFEVPEPKLVIVDGDDKPGADYKRDDNTIIAERFSLVSILAAFACAVLEAKHGEELRAQANQMMEAMLTGRDFTPEVIGFDPIAFGLSMFKQVAPRMFETAKAAGRLMGTSVDYTDNGKITEARRAAELAGENVSDDGHESIVEESNSPTQTDTLPRQAPDLDPENRVDRGSGLGED